MKLIDYTVTEEDPDMALAGSQSVTVMDDAGVLYACHSSFSRGGCLNVGWAVLRNFKTGASKEVDLTSRATDSEAHLRYLLSLAEKHLGGGR